MDIKSNYPAILFGAVVGLICLVVVNLTCLFILQGISTSTYSSPEFIKNLGSICTIGIQFLALLMGAAYFISNIKYDQEKVLRAKRNELLIALVKEYKDIRKHLNAFFYLDISNDDDLKKFKDATVEYFATIALFIENSEKVFIFTDDEYSKLLAPSSVIETSILFSLQSVADLKKHDMNILRSQFASSYNAALSTCWSGLR